MNIPSLILFLFILSISFPVLMRCLTAPEREEIEKESEKNILLESPKFSISQEAASSFKIVSAILLPTPLISCIALGFIYRPYLWDGFLFLLFIIPSVLLMTILSYVALREYNYLFYVSSNTKAIFIFLIPFFPTIVTLNAFIEIAKEFAKPHKIANAGTEFQIATYSAYLILAIMTVILSFKRKRLNAKQDNQ